jgi:hypothetical protein
MNRVWIILLAAAWLLVMAVVLVQVEEIAWINDEKPTGSDRPPTALKLAVIGIA